MACESVIRIAFVHLQHKGVAGCLGENRSSRDFRHQRVAVNYCPGGKSEIGTMQTIYQHFIGFDGQLLHRASHGKHAGLEDIHAINLLGSCARDRPRSRARTDLDGKFDPAFRGKHL